MDHWQIEAISVKSYIYVYGWKFNIIGTQPNLLKFISKQSNVNKMFYMNISKVADIKYYNYYKLHSCRSCSINLP